MKIIVCGAGQVGLGIVRQLVKEENSVTVIDPVPEQVQRVNDTLEVTSFVGYPSHPTVLEKAGAADAEMIIAVTMSDEINMIVCQVAHSLFNIPIKVARIRHKNYLQPMWKDLYRHDHLPIDYIISPEREVAHAIMNRLHVPGAIDTIPFAEEKINVVELRITEDCPMMGQTIARVHDHCSHLVMAIAGIKRQENFIIPDDHETLQQGDEIFFVVDTVSIRKVMSIFGNEAREARRVLIIGGGNIGFFIAQELESEGLGMSAKIIEINKERAEYIASQLQQVTVIHGSSLEQEILFEANVESTETVIAVSNDDEVNLLSSLLCKRFGAQRAFTLINKGRSYGPLVASLGIDVTIDPREMTVSSILQHTRRGKVRAAHAICGGAAEIIETELGMHSSLVGRTIEDIEIPSGVRIISVYREGKVLVVQQDTAFRERDRLIVVVLTTHLRKFDRIFSARMDYF